MTRTCLLNALLLMTIVVGCRTDSKPAGRTSSAETNTGEPAVATTEPALEVVPDQSEPGDPDFPKGSAAFAALVKAAEANDAEGWSKSEATLQELGSRATQALSQGLSDENQVARELAAMLLAQMGPDAAQGASKGLERLLTDESSFARVNAAAALSTLPGYEEKVAPVLATLLTDADDNVRLTAAMALRNLGPAGLSAVGHLARVLSDPNPQVRQEAATTLGELGPDAAKSLPALRQMGNDPEETVVKAAARAIRKIDAASRVPSQTIPASATE